MVVNKNLPSVQQGIKEGSSNNVIDLIITVSMWKITVKKKHEFGEISLIPEHTGHELILKHFDGNEIGSRIGGQTQIDGHDRRRPLIHSAVGRETCFWREQRAVAFASDSWARQLRRPLSCRSATAKETVGLRELFRLHISPLLLSPHDTYGDNRAETKSSF